MSIVQLRKSAINSEKSLMQSINDLNLDTANYVAYPFMETLKGSEIGITNRINIMLKKGTTIEKYDRIFQEIGVKRILPIDYCYGFYQLILDAKDTVNIVNSLFEKSIFEFVELDALIMGKKSVSNVLDPQYPNQWAIKKMEVDKAWDISTGEGIKVAILDDGVDISHPDLKSNLLNTGFDATGNRSDACPQTMDGHGTCCAGIVCESANNIGGRGIAYSSKLLPIRIGYGDFVTTPQWISIGLGYCAMNNIDVVSCSWEVPELLFWSIENFFNSLANGGRGGKGCLIFAASGNSGSSTVSYPARLSSVISVGNSNLNDQKVDLSNYGAGLNLVAPGTGIFTTDQVGDNGYLPGDYKANFGGTSASSPAAAGVMALMLSVNPNLTREQAKTILQSTCDKIGGYTYTPAADGTKSNETGYGRINAWKAVVAAYKTLAYTTGPTKICYNNNGTYSVNYLSSGITGIIWKQSSNLMTVSGQNTNSFIAKNIGTNEQGWVQATLITSSNSFDLPQYNVWLGMPVITSLDGSSFINAQKEYQYRANTSMGSEPTGYTWSISPSGSSYLFSAGCTAYVTCYNPGYYFLSVYPQNSCGINTNFGTGLYVGDANYSLQLSPNPASSHVNIAMVKNIPVLASDSVALTNITVIANDQKKYNVNVYNSFGTLIFSFKRAGDTFSIPVNSLNDGTYLIEVNDGKNSYKQHLIIKH